MLYRHGGKQPSLTFSNTRDAEKMKALIDALGPDAALKALADQGAADRLTVEQLAERFLEWKARDVTERTIAQYRRDVANWITPWFGHRAADSVDEGDVQKWVDHLAGKLRPKSVVDRHMLLHSMYDFGRAKSRQLVDHNPCLETDLPKRRKKPPKGTTVAEFRAILAAGYETEPGRRGPDVLPRRDRVAPVGGRGPLGGRRRGRRRHRRVGHRGRGPSRKPTPHWLRHIHVAVCAAARVQPQEIQRRIGHESITATFGTYGGLIGDRSPDALGAASAIMSGRRSAPGVAPVVRGEVVEPLDAAAAMVAGELEV